MELIRIELSCGHSAFLSLSVAARYPKGSTLPCTRCVDAQGMSPLVMVDETPIEELPEQGRYWPTDSDY